MEIHNHLMIFHLFFIHINVYSMVSKVTFKLMQNMIIIIELMIVSLVKDIKHFILSFLFWRFQTFRSNLMSFDTFSKFEIPPLRYFNVIVIFSLLKQRNLLVIFFQNFTSSFFKILINGKVAISPIYFIQQNILDPFFEIATVSLFFT